MGVALVERNKRQIRLTTFGAALDSRARDILRAVDELADLARASETTFTGRLRMGIIPTIAPYLFPAIYDRVTRSFPDLDLRPREAVTPKLLEELRAAQIDVAVVGLPVSEPELTEIALFEEEFVLVRPISEANKPVPPAEQLREMRLLLLEEGHCFRDQAISFCSGSGTPPRDLIEGGSLSTLVQMVGAGIGVTLIPEMAVDLETRSTAISLARLDCPRPVRTVGMVWRASNPLAKRFGEIAEIVRDLAERKDFMRSTCCLSLATPTSTASFVEASV